MHLECIETEESTEEPYVCLYIDRLFSRKLGPYDMQNGDTRTLGGNNLTGEHVGILLSEADSSYTEKYDDHLGGLEILGEWRGGFATPEEMGLDRMSPVERPILYSAEEIAATPRELDLTRVVHRSHKSGFHYVTLPYHEGSYDHGERRYRLYFYVYLHEHDRYLQPPYCLDLVSLECENAQQWKDYPYIKVNGLTVWGPTRMRDRGDAAFKSINVDPVNIYDVTSVMLWEHDDANKDDLFGEFEVRIGEDFNFGQDLTVTFAPDSTITGDARYTLTYRVRQRRRDIHGNYVDCSEDT